MNHQTDELSASEALAIFARAAGKTGAQTNAATQSHQSDHQDGEELFEHEALAIAERAMASLARTAPAAHRMPTQQRAQVQAPAAQAAPRTGIDGVIFAELNRRLSAMGFTGADGLNATDWAAQKYAANVAKMTGWAGLPKGHTPQSWGAHMAQNEAERITRLARAGAAA